MKPRGLICLVIIFLASLGANTVSSADPFHWKETPGLADLFQKAGVNGTLVVYNVTAGTLGGYNRDRAEQRFTPASTFKIPNTLIGLSVGAVAGVDEVLPYKGPAQPFIKEWARDMSLREAIALSNVPIYQELARRIGTERMQKSLAALDYGNQEIGPAVDQFWLVGPLKISAVEQTRFLAGLAREALPFPRSCQKSLREIIQLDRGSIWALYGKTGWQNAPGPGVGWWVGWVEKEGRIYAFALNMDIQKPEDAAKRIELGKAGLRNMGLLPKE
jgi:beta-lactamase class D